MDVSIPQAIATIINFILLYAILRHFLFDKFNSVIDEREKLITNRINKSEEDMKKAESFKSENEGLLKKAKKDGKSIVEDYKQKAETLSEEIVKDAQNEAELYMERARNEMQREKEKAEEELKSKVVDIAIMLSSKALEESIDEKTHRRLIEDFLAKVGV